MNQLLERSYYQASAEEFSVRDEAAVLGELVKAHNFDTDIMQRNAWQHQIQVIKQLLETNPKGRIFFEFAIPRMGKRADVILLIGGLVFVVEYKVGSDGYSSQAIDQALDYAIDLKNFHEGSHEQKIVPVLVATKAKAGLPIDEWFDDGVSHVQMANDVSLSGIIDYFVDRHGSGEFNHNEWSASTYKPTPTICEAAQALYAGHNVNDITRSDAGAINLSRTAKCVSQIISKSEASGRKSICFVTGVPCIDGHQKTRPITWIAERLNHPAPRGCSSNSN